jgi:hypothetical protein
MRNLFLFFFSFTIFISCNKDEPVIKDSANEELTLLKIANNTPNKAIWASRSQMKSRNGESMGYGVILNPNSDKLLVFLDGGGACFNQLSCFQNLDRYSEEDFSNRITSDSSLLINRNSDQNQFKDWNMVFVPYATGDVHSGTNSSANVPNNGPENQSMVGYTNFSIILEDLKNYFDATGQITEIVFAGSSAGGYGVMSNTFQLINILAIDTPTTVIVDASPIFKDTTIYTPCLNDLWNSDSLWNINSALPLDLDQVVQNNYEYNLQKLYEYLSLKLPNVNFGLLSYYGDSVIRSFYSFGQNNCAYPPNTMIDTNTYKLGLLDLKTTVLDNLKNWKVFYANGTEHTFLSDANFDQTIKETKLNDWILELRQGKAENLTE